MRLATLSPFVLGALACGGPCDTSGQEPIRFADGLTSTQRSTYETTKVDGEYLHFPAGRRYDLVHGLSGAPVSVQTTLSFDARPFEKDGEAGNIAEGSGNLAVIERQDAQVVRVRNDTCAELYLRVVATVE